MSDAPDRIWARYSRGTSPYDGQRGLIIDNKRHEGAAEYIRADLVTIEDAGDDYRLSAATRAMWAERALKAEAERDEAMMQSLSDLGQAQEAWEAQKKAEAERDRLRPLAEAWVAHLETQFQNDDDSAAYYDWRDALRQMEGAKGPTSAENVQLSSASD